MAAPKERTHFIISGTVQAEKWDNSGNVTSLSIVTNSGKEFRICPNPMATKISKFEWDDVEVEFCLADKSTGGPWIEVINFKMSKQEPISLDSHMFDGVQVDWENLKYDWCFDIDPSFFGGARPIGAGIG